MVSFFPVVDMKPSPVVNRMYQEEFKMKNGVMSYNDNFWEGQKMFRNSPGGGKLVLMDLCAMVPEFALRRDQKATHRDAMNFLNDHGCGLGGNFVKFTLYKGYVSALVTIMNSPMVKKAKLYGFHALILVKNCLLANSGRYGLRGMQFTSVDKHAKSTILLAGFWRMKHDNPDKLEVIAINAEGSMITHSNVFD